MDPVDVALPAADVKVMTTPPIVEENVDTVVLVPATGSVLAIVTPPV